MNTSFYKLAKVFNFLPLNILIRITGQKNIFPFYHTVSDLDLVHIKHLYPVRSIKAFEKDLDFFLQNYKAFDIKDILNIEPKKHKGFLLSFDDGLSEFHDIIAPILLRKGIRAICFLNSDFIDNKDLFFRYKASILFEKLNKSPLSDSVRKDLQLWFLQRNLPENNYRSLFTIKYSNKHLLDELANKLEVSFDNFLKVNKPYLSEEQIKNLVKQGFVFGSHSMDHPQFSQLKFDLQLSQINNSIKQITGAFNLDYKLFSFPFTDYGVSRDFFNAIFENTPRTVDKTFGCAGLKKDSILNNIQRIPIEIDNFSAQEIIYGEYLYYIFKSFVNKNTIRR